VSTIAACTILPIGKFQALKEAAVPRRAGLFRRPRDGFQDFLHAEGTALPDLTVDGYYLITALTWLDEKKGVDLMQSEFQELASFLCDARGAYCAFLTPALLDEFRVGVDLGECEPEELGRYFEEFNEQQDPDSGQGMLQALHWLKECLEKTDSQRTGLLVVR
jgi:hypothetical protein